MSDRAEQQRQRDEERQGTSRSEPAKRHGDGLADGTGTRHGVDDRDERPRTEAPDARD